MIILFILLMNLNCRYYIVGYSNLLNVIYRGSRIFSNYPITIGYFLLMVRKCKCSTLLKGSTPTISTSVISPAGRSCRKPPELVKATSAAGYAASQASVTRLCSAGDRRERGSARYPITWSNASSTCCCQPATM